MHDKAHLWNVTYQLKHLRQLLDSLPEPTAPIVVRERQPQGTARQLKEHQVNALVEAYRSGSTLAQLAQRFGINSGTVSNILKRENVVTRFRLLSESDIDEAERLYAEGWSLQKIGRHFNVTGGAIRNRLRRRGVQIPRSDEQP